MYHVRNYFNQTQYEVVRIAPTLEAARTEKLELEADSKYAGKLVIVRISSDGVAEYEQPKERFGFKPPAPSSPVQRKSEVPPQA